MSNPKKMHLTVGADVLARALKHHTKKHAFTRWLHGLIIAMTGLCILLLTILGEWFYAVAMGLAVTGFLLFLPFMQESLARWILARQFKEMAERDDVSKVDCWYDENSINFMTEKSESKVSWSSFTKWREVDGLFVCYRNSRFFHALPQDQMDAEDVVAIRAHLSKHSVNMDVDKKGKNDDGSA